MPEKQMRRENGIRYISFGHPENMTSTNNIFAVVVTYNRCQLLLECLDAILTQTFPVEKIILIDNASTDNTKEELCHKGFLNNDKIDYRLMQKNLGGSGGFYEGLKAAKQAECNWVWIMDDDTIPEKDCLQRLIDASEIIKTDGEETKISFLASAVYGAEGECMNIPNINKKLAANGYPYWYKYLSHGIVGICDATFVSILVNKEGIDRCGLPIKEYFIWGDDSEYTTRLTRYFGDAFFVGASIAIHKRKNAKALSIDNETEKERIKMFWYYYRNNAINNRYYRKEKYSVLRCLKNIATSLKYVFSSNGWEKTKTVAKGYLYGILQYGRFSKNIMDQIKNEQY